MKKQRRSKTTQNAQKRIEKENLGLLPRQSATPERKKRVK